MWLSRFLRRQRCPECGERVDAAFCDACGYEIVEDARAAAGPRRLA